MGNKIREDYIIKIDFALAKSQTGSFIVINEPDIPSTNPNFIYNNFKKNIIQRKVIINRMNLYIIEYNLRKINH
jgi:hypothetical protein